MVHWSAKPFLCPKPGDLGQPGDPWSQTRRPFKPGDPWSKPGDPKPGDPWSDGLRVRRIAGNLGIGARWRVLDGTERRLDEVAAIVGDPDRRPGDPWSAQARSAQARSAQARRPLVRARRPLGQPALVSQPLGQPARVSQARRSSRSASQLCQAIQPV